MPIYRPNELLEFLDSIGARPKKSLSQNFLIDLNILKKIISSAQITPGDSILEIGPGPGSLTELLLEQGARVIAVEKDAILANALQRFTAPHLTIFCQDIMEFPLAEHFKPGHAKVVANLPYHLTTPILTTLLPQNTLFTHLFVMVQEEVARRIVAKPGTPEYGSLTVFCDFFAEPKYEFTIKRSCFFPSPKVDSALVSFRLRTPPLSLEEEDRFFCMTRTAFQQRRKMLRSTLKSLYGQDKIIEALKEADLPPTARPEELSLDQFLTLFRSVYRT